MNDLEQQPPKDPTEFMNRRERRKHEAQKRHAVGEQNAARNERKTQRQARRKRR